MSMSKLVLSISFGGLVLLANSAQAIVPPLTPAQRACSEAINKQVIARYGEDASMAFMKDHTEPAKAPLIKVIGEASILKSEKLINISYKCIYNEDTLSLVSAIFKKKTHTKPK